MKVKIRKLKEKIWKWIKNNLCIIFIVILFLILIKNFYELNYYSSYEKIYDGFIETIKVSVTILISMLGFSVSIYVFLNNTFQNRRNSNQFEREVIDLFQNRKRNKLMISVFFSAIAITVECIIIIFQSSVKAFFSAMKISLSLSVYTAITGIILITLYNIYKLVHFTYGIINYEEGLSKLAKQQMDEYDKISYYQEMTKGEFLNLVNNIEVIVERLIENHSHAKMSSTYDSDLKRAICDGITDSGDITTREILAEDYKKIINYRNLLLQNKSIADSRNVAMGDQIKSIMNRLFQNYLKSELLTGVSISNFTICNADLEKTSFSNSLLKNIYFDGKTNLKNTDFRDSTLNGVHFKETNCENANFTNCKLIGILFDTKMKLQRTIFTNADLSGMDRIGPCDKEGALLNFDYSNFSKANLSHLDIYNTTFEFADFSDVRLVDAKIGDSAQKENNIIFSYANMEKANLLRSIIKRCNFQNANLQEATFTYSILEKVSFEEARLNKSSFSECKIENCYFGKSYCANLSMKGAIISDSSFIFAIMISVDMSNVHLEQISFCDAVCRDTLWINARIENSNFERCVLSNARFVGDAKNRIRISNCKFINTNFSDVAIANVEFYKCDFKGADFTNARLINVKFIECKNLDNTVTQKIWMEEVAFIKSEKPKYGKLEDLNWRHFSEESYGKEAI
ncbi:pentapeptide repeat-containing protein [Anaerostipes butyraticus]|uniref:Pentapeptide repeat-containing protein n=1 Tax=Anaerostipes butyraticus TaxID=645466 RepID=A0A916QBQ5_9FIRM|nr:pentapeptide repeat-containing protein [Anaerostipes butyraticus]GFO86201.1 hypothetical protein ANBU17_25480 [Anaerostipes butyraticus]